MGIINVLELLGIPKKLITSLIPILKLLPILLVAELKKADYALKKGDLKTSIKGYESALEIDNSNNIVRTNLAHLYYQDGEFKKVEDAVIIIMEQEPECGQTYYFYGLLLAELNRYEEAVTQLQKAIKYMPENIGHIKI